MRINVPEDSGNAIVLPSENPQEFHLAIRKDNDGKDETNQHNQWFHFDILEGEIGDEFTIQIEGADKTSYAGWNEAGVHYQAMASIDGIEQPRLETHFDETTGTLTIRGKLTSDHLTVSFFTPFSYAQHQELIASATAIPNCTTTVLGQSVEGRDITLLSIGTPAPVGEPDKKNIWIIARQHPGETMAEHYAKGLMDSLRASQPPEFFDHAIIHIVPNMNPDGSYHGNLRTNAAGLDLNRQWDKYDNESTCPEVFYVRREMLKRGVAAFFDIHGDEINPYVFPDGKGLGKDTSPDITTIEQEFVQEYQKLAPYLESKSHYEPDTLKGANLGLARAFFAERLNCLSILFEMPNKQLASGEDWTAKKCEEFGAQLVPSLLSLLPRLENKKLLDGSVVRGLSFLIEQRKASETIAAEDNVTFDTKKAGCCVIM